VGGGYVGLVTGACFAELGHSVDIVEIDGRKAAAIDAGHAPIHERGLDALLERHAGARLSAGTDYDPVAAADLSFICVGTPPGLKVLKSQLAPCGAQAPAGTAVALTNHRVLRLHPLQRPRDPLHVP